MDRAMELLVTDSLPIATVAHAVGFRHQASFTSAFRAHFGFTPRQARQRVTTSGGG
jgi:transcriptional regulator GlxA family with amidase domain